MYVPMYVPIYISKEIGVLSPSNKLCKCSSGRYLGGFTLIDLPGINSKVTNIDSNFT